MSKNILVVGGAGYVGSHTCLALHQAGFTPVVYDNFLNGLKEFIKWGPYVEGDIRDKVTLKETFDEWKPIGVMHFAALTEAGQSVRSPKAFYDTNVIGSFNLINAAFRANVRAFIFSSPCATYGKPKYLPIDEHHTQEPINPYGNTKLIVEKYLHDLQSYAGFQSIALRYFNAAGALPEHGIGECHSPETHAIPIAIEAAMGVRNSFSILGTNYETRDGSYIRDYIHVADLAAAHVLSLQALLTGKTGRPINLGTGVGTSVIELTETIRRVSKKEFLVETSPARLGDSPVLVANKELAERYIKWQPKKTFNDIISDAWVWHTHFQRPRI